MTNDINEQQHTRIVANWIFVGVAMLIIQVLLGGITRLTGSGLSITEWKPLLGFLPPMNEHEWQIAFEKYKQIGQARYINSHFTLSDFKSIFFWEWLHRNWARFIGFAFAVPFVYFLIKQYFKQWMVKPLIILFVLGALQGAIGWIMVQTGLNPDDVAVSHISLATHFISAMVLICYALVFGMMLTTKPHQRIVDASLKNITVVLLLLLVIQLTYGAFMAGLKAATAAPTWPDMNGVFAPDMQKLSWINSPVAVQFIHRTIAYLLLLSLIAWWFSAKKHTASSLFNKTSNWVLVLIVVQVTLGILSVLNSLKIVPGRFGSFEWIALAHQLVGMLLLLALVAAFYLLKWSRKYTF
jgi:heme a synthase